MATVLALNGLKVDLRAEGESSGDKKYKKTIAVTVTDDCSIGFDPSVVERDEERITSWIGTNLSGKHTITPQAADNAIPSGKKKNSNSVVPTVGDPGITGNTDTGWVILKNTTFTYTDVNTLEDE